MREVDQALLQISEIHQHLSRTEVFRGYRTLPIALAGVSGIIGAVLQNRMISSRPPEWFVYYWVSVAIIAFSFAISGIILHWINHPDPYHRRHTLTVTGQFRPCLVAGCCLTVMLTPLGESAIRLLPGLWATLYSLGIFALKPYLPTPHKWVAAFYLIAGMVLSGMVRDGASLSP
jgi:hypothetical protein